MTCRAMGDIPAKFGTRAHGEGLPGVRGRSERAVPAISGSWMAQRGAAAPARRSGWGPPAAMGGCSSCALLLLVLLAAVANADVYIMVRARHRPNRTQGYDLLAKQNNPGPRPARTIRLRAAMRAPPLRTRAAAEQDVHAGPRARSRGGLWARAARRRPGGGPAGARSSDPL